MKKWQLQNLSLVFGLFIALLVSPIISVACACASHKIAETDEHSSHRAAENNCHSDIRQTPPAEETANADCKVALRQNNCCCVKNGGQIPFLSDKKIVQPDNFNALLLPTHFDFSIVKRAASIRFYTPEIIHLARSALADKPSRAPPVL